jgi:hypothetical protein
MPIHERFWTCVEKTDSCWLWTASTSRGYGIFSWQIDHRRHTVQAHRYAYQQIIGAIPDGLQLDHLCRIRRCVRPSHLEPVTNLENQRRGLRANATHCINGHPFDAENTYVKPDGGRQCKTCRRATDAKRRSLRSRPGP